MAPTRLTVAAAAVKRNHTSALKAVALLIISGLCDLLDGLVARRLFRDEEERRFGARLNSVVDGCAFGMAPAVLLFAVGLVVFADRFPALPR